MDLKKIDSLIDFCKGNIVSLEKALMPLPYQKYDKNSQINKTNKLKRFKAIIKALEELKGYQ